MQNRTRIFFHRRTSLSRLIGSLKEYFNRPFINYVRCVIFANEISFAAVCGKIIGFLDLPPWKEYERRNPELI